MNHRSSTEIYLVVLFLLRLHVFQVFVCDVALCGRFYHLDCLGQWKEQEGTLENRSDFIRSVKEGDGFCCPAHNCRRCGKSEEESADNLMKLAKCRRCPKAFHKMCLPRCHLHSFPQAQVFQSRNWQGNQFEACHTVYHSFTTKICS